jgi:hypothetical protein
VKDGMGFYLKGIMPHPKKPLKIAFKGFADPTRIDAFKKK